ncbi:hypothetical protein [Cedecea davisae]|uniref:hypothetical protein n=1 Tax=Cedecea davisae TaxID=158484 RepID=UPI001D09C428|nr:hypothetical protein [Cedecea davisae]
MAANVEYEFNNYFEVDEEKIRRIHSILKNRIQEDNHNLITFTVKKADNFIYHTSDINSIISEPNDSTSKISGIDIDYISSQIIIGVSLNKKNGASINVSGEDRDDVFLLSSELREYIAKEVANIKKLTWLHTRTFLVIAMIIFTIYMTYIFTTLKSVDTSTMKLALDSTNPNDKLNFLINKEKKELPATPIIPMFGLLTLIMIAQIIPTERIIAYIYPRNLFLFGKEISLIEKKKRNRSNIFWVVGVGSLISLLVAFISTKFMQ